MIQAAELPLAGRRVLIVEDRYLIAAELAKPVAPANLREALVDACAALTA